MLHGTEMIGPKLSLPTGIKAEFQPDCVASGLKVSAVRENKATISYYIQGTQVIEFGVCYGRNPNPTLENSGSVSSYRGGARNIPPINSPFKENITGLDTATVYYVRAYVKNSRGNACYSPEISFKTKSPDDYSALLNGEKRDLYPNGRNMRVYYMKNGKLDGPYKMFSESGDLVSEQQYKNGKPDGYLRTFYKNGHVKAETNFTEGVANGSGTEYYENGNLKAENKCSGDISTASCLLKFYYEDGKLMKETETSNGQVLKSTTYDREGRVTYEQTPGKTVSYSYDNDGTRHVFINGVEQK